MSRRLIVVSNRGPVGYERDAAGQRRATRGAGGLVTALRPLVSRHEVTWIASALSAEERAIAAAGPVEEQAADGSPFRLHFVAHDPEAYRLFYEVVANPALWFVQHGLWELKQDPAADLTGPWERGYVAVNATFAEAVIAELDRDPDAVVLFQDYHLYVAPALVRSERPAARIAQFIHIPWVGAADWAVLPPAIPRAVHEGLLACDSVGFQVERWRSAFVEASETLLGRGADAAARSHANPIAVDVAELEEFARSAAVHAAEADLLESRPERLILRVDRTDPSKNAIAGFAAYGRLLERRPDLHGRIGMLALLDPSRQTIPEYVHYRDALEREAISVNDRFGGAGWTPIDLRIRNDFAGSVAAYRQYDVLLVNPVLDGLNLVAKEAPLVNDRAGVLVLSRSAGAFDELGEWAIGIDPGDVEGDSRRPRAGAGAAARRTARAARGDASPGSHARSFAWAEAELAALDARSTMRA